MLYQVVNDLLIFQLQVFGKHLCFGQHGQVAFFIGGVHPFEYGVLGAQVGGDFPYEIVVVYQVFGAQVVNPGFIPVDHVVHLLGQFVIRRYIHHEVRKDFDGLFEMQGFFNFFDSGGSVPKNHGQTQDGRFTRGQPEQHILNTDFQSAVDTLRQGFIVLIGRVFAVGVKNIGRGEKEQPYSFAADEFSEMNVGLYLGCEVAPQGRDDYIGFYFLQQAVDIIFLHVVPVKLSVILKTPSGRTVGAKCVVVIAELLVQGVPQEAAASQYQYSLSGLLHVCWGLPFVEWRSDHSSRQVVFTDLNPDSGPRLCMGNGNVPHSDPFAQGRGHGT